MRNSLLTSTAAVCLLLAGQVANAQSDQKKEEMKNQHAQQQQEQRGHQAQQQQQRAGQAQQQQHRRSTTGQAADDKTDTNKSDMNKGAASTSEKKNQNAATKPSSESNSSAQENRKRDESKSANEQKQNASPNKSTASEHNKGNQSAKPSTAEAPKSSMQRQENASTPSGNTNATNDTGNNNNINATNNANNNSNSANRNASNSAGQIDPQKKTRISETFSKQRNLAPPVHNTNISITVGQRVPRDIHLHALPREIVTIAPEYRDYEYFTTRDDILIVSPRTHEIVSQIPRDASRARAEVGGGFSSTAMSSSASTGGSPCQVMQRTASGDMKPMDEAQLRETTGSGGSSDRLAVTVQAPSGQQMPNIALPEQRGRIIAETDGNGGCQIIIEPGQVGR